MDVTFLHTLQAYHRLCMLAAVCGKQSSSKSRPVAAGFQALITDALQNAKVEHL